MDRTNAEDREGVILLGVLIGLTEIITHLSVLTLSAFHYCFKNSTDVTEQLVKQSKKLTSMQKPDVETHTHTQNATLQLKKSF